MGFQRTRLLKSSVSSSSVHGSFARAVLGGAVGVGSFSRGVVEVGVFGWDSRRGVD